jgi:hypothetical protein
MAHSFGRYVGTDGTEATRVLSGMQSRTGLTYATEVAEIAIAFA